VGPRTVAAWAKFKKDRFLSDPDLVGVSSLQLLLNAPERSGYFLPTDGVGWVSSPCGVRSMGFHRGVDIAANHGTPVYAVADGFVSIAVDNCRIGDFRCGWGYGNVVYVDHPNGLQTRYAYLTDVTVKNGQRVKRGEKLGTVGNTGHSYGPHLHFEYRVNGTAIDPLTKINPIV
jgi:murein DD-endopeptidase MepM/ murein hydrolase activator NlpD